MYKKLLFLGCFLSLFSSLNAQTTLSAGDIAIIGLNYDSVPYEMAIVNLVPLSSGTVVRITDYAYDESTSTFSTVSTGSASEGSIEWTLTSAMAAGTVTKFTINAASGTPVITGLPGTVSVIGWTNTTITACPSAAGGDNWFIFQGPNPTSVSTYVFAWCNPFALTHNTISQIAGQFLVPGSGLSNIFNSYLPPSLTLGTNAISLSRDPASGGYHGDNNIYIGPKTGNKNTIITAISTISNWNTNETTPYDLNPGGTYFTGPNPVFTVTTTCALNLTAASQTNVSCFGGFNGTASVSPTGGTPSYTYSWSPSGGTAATATGLSAGTYTVTVTDANLCSATRNFTITQPPAINTATAAQTNVSCNGGSNGSASVSPTGGAGGYTYSWSPSGGTAATATGLSAGTYTVTVTDANSCTATRNFTITQPTAIITATAAQTNVSCNGGSNGSASVSPTGGAGGYTYSWSPSGGTAATATGLSAGTYTVTVTDANSCTATRNFTITQPPAINTATAAQTNVSCNGGSNGSASVSPTGGAGGYTYSWSPSGGTAATATGLSAGTYTVTVTDANSCTANRNFIITQPTAIITATAAQTNVSCNGGSNGSASVSPSGGAGGYTYSWSPSGGTAASATGLSAGTYTVTVTDANSCTATRNFIITQPTAIDNSVTLTSGILTATQTGATYQWFQCPNTILSGETNQTFTPTLVGDYKVEISVGGCTNTSSCVTVTTLESSSFDSTNFVYYPNPTSDILHISNGNVIDEVTVFNLIGQPMVSSKFKSKEIKLNIETLPTGTYFITIKSEGKSKTIKILKK